MEYKVFWTLVLFSAASRMASRWVLKAFGDGGNVVLFSFVVLDAAYRFLAAFAFVWMVGLLWLKL